MEENSREISVKEAANELMRSPDTVRKLIRKGLLSARKEGEGLRCTYFVEHSAVVALRNQWYISPPRVGRPKKKT